MKFGRYLFFLYFVVFQVNILGFLTYFQRLSYCFSKGRESIWFSDRVLHLSSRNPDSSEFWHPSIAPKLDFNECYYSVLEVDPAIDFRGLKKAYHKLVYKYHPDRKTNPRLIAIANNQMKVINLAYTVLRNSETREEYDRQRAAGRVGAHAQIKMEDTNAADVKIKPEKEKSSPSQTPPPPKTSSKSTTSTASFTEEDIDLDRIRRNVEQVWANYMKTKHGANKDKEVNSRMQRNNNDVSDRETKRWTSADQSKREEVEEVQSLRREREKTQFEREYEKAEEENNQIYAAIFKIRGSALTVSSIKNGLLYLYRIKERKTAILNSDTRDWGEVTRKDEIAVYHRLKSIEVLKAINALISELEEKLHLLTRTYGLGGDDDSEDEWNDLWQDEEHFRKRYSNRDYYPPNQPRPQTQPQRSKDPRSPKTPWRFDDDDIGFNRRVKDDDDYEDLGHDDSDFFFLR